MVTSGARGEGEAWGCRMAENLARGGFREVTGSVAGSGDDGAK